MRFLNKLATIDSLVANEPTDTTASLLPTDEIGQDTLDGYLLRQIKGDAWLAIAKQVFQRHQDTSNIAAFEFFTFLLTCSGRSAVEAALANAQGTSADWQSILRVAHKAGVPAASTLLQMFAAAEIIPDKRALRDIALSLVQDAFNAGYATLACAVLRRFLRIEPDPSEQQGPPTEGRRILFGPDPSIGLDPYSLQEFLSALVDTVPTSSALSVMKVLADALSDSIRLSYWPDDRADRTAAGYDGSVFWRPAVEEHEQNSDLGCRGQLVVAIRDLGERIANSSEKFDDIDASLGNSNWSIFKRIRLHLIRKYPSVAGEKVRQVLADEKLRGSDTWHEWSMLLQEQFRNLAHEEQNKILEWAVKDLSRWSRVRAIIQDNIPEDWKAAHPDLCANLDEVEHPTFHYYNSGGIFRQIEEKSPKATEEIIATPARALVEGLAHWQQEDRYDGPSEWGLLGALKAAAKQEPSNFLSRISEYQGLAPARYVALLEGLWESANESGSIDWPLLLTETENTVRERMLPAAISVDKNGEKGFGISIIRAIEVALERKLPPIDQRHTVLSCIAAFLEHPHPQPSDEEASTLPDKLSMQSLNTPRPIAIRCLFAYDEWLRVAGISDAEEVLSKLERVLQAETTLSGRSVLGEKLNWFLRYHAEWTKKHLHELFPPDAPGKGAAVWNCFVTMCGASKVALEIFLPEYERAIEDSQQELDEKLSSDWSPRKGLVRHLCAYYWWGLEPINHPSLVKTFFETSPANLRSYAFSYIGQALANTDGELPEDVSQRFQALADWRIKVLQASDGDSPERQELQGFVRWVDADKLPVEWSLQTLHEVLKLVSGSLNEHQMLPFDFLAKHAEQYPALTIGCMHALTFGSKKTPPWWGQESEAKKILRVAFASKDKETIRQAEEIQDHLLRLGRLQYRNLEPEGE